MCVSKCICLCLAHLGRKGTKQEHDQQSQSDVPEQTHSDNSHHGKKTKVVPSARKSHENVMCLRCDIYYTATSKVCIECGDNLHRSGVSEEQSDAEDRRTEELVPKPIPPPFIEPGVSEA